MIDSVFESGGTFATEWLSNADKPPVLQVVTFKVYFELLFSLLDFILDWKNR